MRFPFTQQARNQLRQIDREIALEILHAITRFGTTGAGDVRPLHGDYAGSFRLRVGDYRVIFRYVDAVIEITAVGHRSEVYW